MKEPKNFRCQHLNAEVPEFHPKVSGATTASATTIISQSSTHACKQIAATSSLLNLSENRSQLNSNHKTVPVQSIVRDSKYPSELFSYRVLSNSRSDRQLSSLGTRKFNEVRETEQLFIQNNNCSYKFSSTGLPNRNFAFGRPQPYIQKNVCTSYEKEDALNRYESDQCGLVNRSLNKSKSARKENQKTLTNSHVVHDKIDLLYPFDFDTHVAIAQWIRTGYSTRANDFNYVSALMSDTAIIPILKDKIQSIASSTITNNICVQAESKVKSQKPVITEIFPDLVAAKSDSKKKNTKKVNKKKVEVQEILEPKKRLYSAVLCNSSQASEFISPLVELPITEINRVSLPSDTTDVDTNCVTLCLRNISGKEEYSDHSTPDISKKTASTGSMEKCYEELERQAIEQYKESDESLDSKYYQELERQAVEQYSASSQSNIDNQPQATASMDSSQLSTDTNAPLKVDVINFIKLGKATPKQKKKGKKRKSKRTNLKNLNSPHTGADLKSNVAINKDLNSVESRMGKTFDYFIIQYTYKCKTINLKLLVRNEELAKHMKNIAQELKSGVICRQCKFFSLMSSVEELYSGKGIHYFPIEECTFTDLNHFSQVDDESCVMTTKVFFEGKEIEVYREMSNMLFCNANLRLMVPSRTYLENFKKHLPKSAIEKKIIKHTANSHDTTRHFLQMGVRAIHNCNIFCHFIYYSCRHELNDYSNIKLMGYERVRRLIDHVRSVWRAAKGYYASGIFFDGYPPNMTVKLWSPFKYLLRAKRFNKEPERDKSCEGMIKYRCNSKNYNFMSKTGSLKSLHTFIDQFEIKHMIESEYIYTMLNLQKHFSGMVHYKYYAKPNDTDEISNSIKFDCEFIRNVSGILRNVNPRISEYTNNRVGFFGKSVEPICSNTSIYHITADILEKHWLFMWGFVAVDLNICDPWNYDNDDHLNDEYPIYYPKFIVKKPIIDSIPVKPIYQNPHICSCKNNHISEYLQLTTVKNKKKYLQLSEQQKGDLKSLIALTLNREIKSKEDVQKISVTMSKLIKNEIIDKLEQMSINKKLNTERAMIIKSAEKIHRKIINSTLTEIVLELCRGRKMKDSDLERKEQIFAAMIENLKQLYNVKNEAQERNSIQVANILHSNGTHKSNNISMNDDILTADQRTNANKKNMEVDMQTANSSKQRNACVEVNSIEVQTTKTNRPCTPIVCTSRNIRLSSGDKNKSKPLTETASYDIIHKITRYSPRPNRKNKSPSLLEAISQTSSTPQMVLGEEEEELSEDNTNYSEAADKKPDTSCGVM